MLRVLASLCLLWLFSSASGQPSISVAQGDPHDARMTLAQVEALEKLGRWYEARHVLAQAAESSQDLMLLRRYAEVEDTYGGGAPACYRLLAEVLEKSGSGPDYIPTLVRGFQVSLRENDPEHENWFASRLVKAGHSEYAAAMTAVPAKSDPLVPIPGGGRALMFIAGAREQGARGSFFAQYCRTLLDWSSSAGLSAWQEFKRGISDHFKRIADLEDLGRRNGSRVSILLSVSDDKSRKTTEEALRLLGWDVRFSRNAVKLEASDAISAAGCRLTAASLYIDEPAMQQALESGRPFEIEIVDDAFPVRFGLNFWRSQFFADKEPPGGFAEALALDPVLAKLYVGLAALDDACATALLRTIGVRQLAAKYCDLLYLYASALAVSGNRVMFPGGDDAAPIWVKMVGSHNDSPAEFFPSLLKNDSGKLLAFYFNMAQLDTKHQKLCSRSLERTRQYYEMFKGSPGLLTGLKRAQREAPFVEFIQRVSLDAAGNVKFPGGPKVWMAAKGASADVAGTEALLRKVVKTSTPDREDEILMRLMRISYTACDRQRSELDNFLAVASIDGHRVEPLDERSTLMLAQQFPNYFPAWPYFCILTGLKADDFQRFFALGSRLHGLKGVLMNDCMGQFHALVAILCRLQQAGRLSEQQSAALFGTICDRFTRANGAGELTTASLEITREILNQALGKMPLNPDQAIEDLLLDEPAAASPDTGGQEQRLEAARSRHENFRKVLELQKVTSLGTLFAIQEAVGNLQRDLGDGKREVQLIEDSSGGLLTVEVPEPSALSGAMKDNLLSCRPKTVADLIARLGLAVAGKTAGSPEIQKITGQLLAAINPQVKIALAGIVYACYLKSDDLPVLADPLLLRKHQFVRLDGQVRPEAPFYSADILGNTSAGRYFLGGFADFAKIAGRVALTNARRMDDKVEPYFISQLGSIRSARLQDLKDEDLRLVALKISCAREWIVQAAERPELLAELADGASGLLSFTRRADLLQALQSRDWKSAWSSVTQGDLYHLGDEYLRRYGTAPWNSPVTAALRRLAAASDGLRLQILGSNLQPLLFCSDPHLLRLSPYEYYERYLLLDKIAARTAEFEISLAAYFDKKGLPASLLGDLAEPLAREVFRSMQLADLRDWQSVVSAYAALDDDTMARVNRERR